MIFWAEELVYAVLHAAYQLPCHVRLYAAPPTTNPRSWPSANPFPHGTTWDHIPPAPPPQPPPLTQIVAVGKSLATWAEELADHPGLRLAEDGAAGPGCGAFVVPVPGTDEGLWAGGCGGKRVGSDAVSDAVRMRLGW